MEVLINGQAQQIQDGTRLSEFLAAKGLDPRTIVVEYNERILAPEEFPAVVLGEDDKVEILRFVGGG